MFVGAKSSQAIYIFGRKVLCSSFVPLCDWTSAWLQFGFENTSHSLCYKYHQNSDLRVSRVFIHIHINIMFGRKSVMWCVWVSWMSHIVLRTILISCGGLNLRRISVCCNTPSTHICISVVLCECVMCVTFCAVLICNTLVVVFAMFCSEFLLVRAR